MTRSIISKLIIILIILFTALSAFWFFKTSAIKKQALALISYSGGSVSAASVSVAGFPLEQKLAIDDIKIQLSLLNSLPNASNNSIFNTLIVNNKYQILIKKLEASASIFSGNFIINSIGETSFQDQGGASNFVQFNQPPKSSFSVLAGDLKQFSYQDSGYKILDAGKNILFENGNSAINFTSTIEGGKYHNKLRADFKDVGDLKLDLPILTPTTTAVADAINSSPTVNKAVENTVEVMKPADNQVAVNNQNNLVKRNIALEIEYIVAKPSIASAPVPNPASQNTATSDIAPTNEQAIESLSIKNFEISSSLYKLNINGEITSFLKDAIPTGSISLRVERLENALIHMKKTIASLPNSSANNSDSIPDANVTNHVDVVAVPTSTSDSATSPASNQKPKVDIVTIIRDLSKKNVATNDEIAVFDFRKEQDKDLLINDILLSEITSQIFINSATNPSTTLDNAATNANDAAIIQPLPKMEIPYQPKNAH